MLAPSPDFERALLRLHQQIGDAWQALRHRRKRSSVKDK